MTYDDIVRVQVTITAENMSSEGRAARVSEIKHGRLIDWQAGGPMVNLEVVLDDAIDKLVDGATYEYS